MNNSLNLNQNAPFWDSYFQETAATKEERESFFAILQKYGFDPVLDVYPRRNADNMLVPVLRHAGYLRYINSKTDKLDGIQYDYGELVEIPGLQVEAYNWIQCNIYLKGMRFPIPARVHVDEVLNTEHEYNQKRPKDRLQQLALIAAAKAAFPLPGLYTFEDLSSESDSTSKISIKETLVESDAVSAESTSLPPVFELPESVYQSLDLSAIDDLNPLPLTETPADTQPAEQLTDATPTAPEHDVPALSDSDQQLIQLLIDRQFYSTSISHCEAYIRQNAENPDLCWVCFQMRVEEIQPVPSAEEFDLQYTPEDEDEENVMLESILPPALIMQDSSTEFDSFFQSNGLSEF